MALPTIYFDTGGSASNSGSTDNNSPIVSSASSGQTASASGTTVTFSGNVDLSGVAADGSQTIYINDATNSNQKIFKITGVDDGANTVTVNVTPTGTIAASSWAIGGRMVYTSANWEGAAAPGWMFIFNNNPAAKSGSSFLTARTAGNDSDGMIRVIGKAGAKRVLTVTDTNIVITGTVAGWYFENLELVQQGASGQAVENTGIGWIFYDCKVSDAGSNGFRIRNESCSIIACEVSGVGQAGIRFENANCSALGTYIHDTTLNGIEISTADISATLIGNIVDTAGDRGIQFVSTSATGRMNSTIMGNTVYGCGNSGLELSDVDVGLRLYNNVFSENGNASGEYNVEFAAGSIELQGCHGWNIFFKTGGSNNLSGLTPNATESTGDPLFVDPANGDFRLQASSPAKGAGFPGAFPGGPTSYLDMGAVQRQEAGGGGSFTWAG